MKAETTYMKTLGKIEAKLTRMKEQASAVRWFYENGNLPESYNRALRLEELSEQTVLLTRVLPAYTGAAGATVQTDAIISDTIPVEVGFTAEGWFSVRIPALLPKKASGSADYIRSYLYPAMRKFFDGKPPVRFRDCVLAYRHVYDRSRPERAMRDHDNIETNMVTDILALYVLPDDHPAVCSHYYCSAAGSEDRTEVYMLPILQNRTITKRIPDAPCYYLAKELKKLGEAEMNKTMFTRMVGTAYLGQRPYAVYNTRSAVMKWSGKGEFKTLHSVIEISRLNAGTDAAPAAILFGQSESVALKTLLESDTTKRPEFRFDAIYRNLYFIPMDEHGIRQLRLMTVPDWKERLLELLFDPDVRTYDRGLFEYDAKIGDAYVFSHLDGDLARLVRFKEAVENQRGNYEVLCYPYQMAFIREYLGNRITIKTIGFDAVEAELDPERRDLFER